MKKVVLFLLIFGVVMSSGTSALADMEDILGNHWSSKVIEKDFLIYYFPYLAKENFKRFDPNGTINEDEFSLSFSSLLKNNGYSNTPIGFKVELTRAKMAKFIGNKLMEIKLIAPSNEKLPFTDIGQVSTEEQKAIAALYHSNIIQGQSETIYNPTRKVTQAEAIIVLQRVSKLFDKTTSIPFKLSGAVQTYSGKEGITFKTEGDKVLVTITKEFPTPGYSMKVEEVLKHKNDYKIRLNITPPKKDSNQLQVITYKTMTIEIDKEQLGNPPYNFVLEGFLTDIDKFCMI